MCLHLSFVYLKKNSQFPISGSDKHVLCYSTFRLECTGLLCPEEDQCMHSGWNASMIFSSFVAGTEETFTIQGSSCLISWNVNIEHSQHILNFAHTNLKSGLIHFNLNFVKALSPGEKAAAAVWLCTARQTRQVVSNNHTWCRKIMQVFGYLNLLIATWLLNRVYNSLAIQLHALAGATITPRP